MKRIIRILSNPLLYYVDKTGSVFRNFCLFSKTGNLYKTSIPKANVGKALEYRFDLENYLKIVYILTPIILYFIFIHLKFSLIGLLFFEFLWILIITFARLYCSFLYRSYLIEHFGSFEVVEFEPPIKEEKHNEYVSIYKSKFVAIIILIALFFVPALILQGVIKLNTTSKKPNFKRAVALSNAYFSIYPKCQNVYDMRAMSKYMVMDYEGALNDYKAVLDLSGKKYSDKDLVRFANMLLIQKRLTTPVEAIDVFNEYATKKKFTPLEASQMLWIKSIFKIENGIPETIEHEYEELIESMDSEDVRNQFYVASDKAYMYYLMEEYSAAIYAYNVLISFVGNYKDIFNKDVNRLYAERGWAKKRMNDNAGANEDFKTSGFSEGELKYYEPAYTPQEFVVSTK